MMKNMQLYHQEYYQKRRAITHRSASKIVSLISTLSTWRTVVDFGCADGTWLSVFQRTGTSTVFGIDGPWVDVGQLQIPADSFMTCDLSSALPKIDRRFDLATCIEVIEHISDDEGHRLLDTITEAAPAVLFSAAVPHQGGTGHVNERRQSYWMEAFRERGFVCLDLIRRKLWYDAEVNVVYRQNMFLYVHETQKELIENFSVYLLRNPSEADVIHPDLYELRMKNAENRNRGIYYSFLSFPRRVHSLFQRITNW